MRRSISNGSTYQTLLKVLKETEGALQLVFQKTSTTLINHYNDAKTFWDNVKMILEGVQFTNFDERMDDLALNGDHGL
ncbi:hypothetical protein Tco_0581717 [Tanacetum coccineum]